MGFSNAITSLLLRPASSVAVHAVSSVAERDMPKSPRIVHRAPRAGSVTRVYEAAKYDRHTEGWWGDYGVSQWDILGQLQVVRNRAREMCKNDPHLQRWLWQRRNNIIGATGFKLVPDVADWIGGQKRPDRMANGIIVRGWESWAETPEWCDANGRKTLPEILQGLDRDYAREGESLLVFFPGKQNDNPHNFSVRRVRPDSLAIRYSTELDNGNSVFNGVEVSKDGRVAAYWFYSQMLPTGIWGGELFRVDADLVCHRYDEDYEGQHRGFPVVACVLRSVKILHQYIDAELIKARRQAYSSGEYYVDPSYPMADPKDVADPQTEDGRAQFQQDIEPGEDRIVPAGWRYQQPTPTAPNPNFALFKQEMLRIVASGIGAAYHNLASDFGSINWSAGRLAEGEQREGWKTEQAAYINHVLRPIYRRPRGWLSMWLASGNSPLPFSKLSKFRTADEWRGKRWFPADPANEIPMLETGVRRGWWADQDIAAEMGYGSFEENVAKTKQDDADAAGTSIADRNILAKGGAPTAQVEPKAPAKKEGAA